MTDARDRDLEDRLDRAFHALPAPAAPPTLLPRVMAVVELEAALAAPVEPAALPSVTWWKWSWPARVASLAGAACLFALIVYGWSHLDPDAVIRLAGNGRAGDLWRAASAGVTASMAIGRLLQPVAIAAAVLIGIMVAACAAFGAALRDVALGGSSS